MIEKPITGPGQLGPCHCQDDKCEAPVILGRQTPCILRREIAEMQELCDDLSSSVIAAAFLAPHGSEAKALLDEAIERMATRARRKVGAGGTAVTREMITAAHGVTLETGDVVLSAKLLERIYKAMAARQPLPRNQPSTTCKTCEALARTVMMDQTGAA